MVLVGYTSLQMTDEMVHGTDIFSLKVETFVSLKCSLENLISFRHRTMQHLTVIRVDATKPRSRDCFVSSLHASVSA